MTNEKVQSPIPDYVDLEVEDGTYQATMTNVQVDKAGQYFRTSMSGYGNEGKRFGTHVWFKKKLTDKWQCIQSFVDCHGWLEVIGNELFYIVNLKNGNTVMYKIKRWQGVRS